MAWYKDVWKIINKSGVSTNRTADGNVTIRSASFKGLPIERQNEINEIIDDHQKEVLKSTFGGFETPLDVRKRSSQFGLKVLETYVGKRLEGRARDAIGIRDITPVGSMPGGNGNYTTNAGVPGQDPSLNNFVQPNLYLSPMDAVAIYSQKGIEETIFRKKSQSIILNGVRIKNPKFTPQQQEKIDENMTRLLMAHQIANGTLQSLIQGGALMFPVFFKDNPATFTMNLEQLARAGILGKNCVQRFVVLDRWNVVHVPNWNPTAEDYKNPKRYFIPFLGSDLNGDRCSRIVTAEQPTYWGMLMTLGWGIADSVGWYEAVMNYKNVMRSVPNMINQMSVLVRRLNMEVALATEGAAALEDFDYDNTIRVREVSINNPVAMDVVGELEAINRDFQQVPELVRLVRQDAAAKATIPEELIWSSERGAFASGDTTDSAFEKQSEGTRYIHIDVAAQLKRIAQIIVIDTLGLTREVAQMLPYTTFEFDNPRVTNAKDKAEIGGKMAKGFFDFVAGGAPVDAAMDITQQLSDEEFHVSDKAMQQLKDRQAQKDQREQEKHDKEMELLDAQIRAANASAQAPKAGGIFGFGKKPASGGDAEKKGHSYKDPLEQKQHEKVGSGQKQGLQKAAGKEKV